MKNKIESVWLVIRYTSGYREFEVFTNKEDAYKYQEDGKRIYRHTIIEQPLRYELEDRIKLHN